MADKINYANGVPEHNGSGSPNLLNRSLLAYHSGNTGPSVIPSYIRQDTGPRRTGFETARSDNALHVGRVLKAYPPDSKENQNKKATEYDVEIYVSTATSRTQRTYHNVRVGSLFGGGADYLRWTPRLKEVDDKGNTKIGTGSMVLMVCLDSFYQTGIIIGGLPNGEGNVDSLEADGHNFRFEFNGINASVDKDGAFTLIRKGPTSADGTPVKASASTSSTSSTATSKTVAGSRAAAGQPAAAPKIPSAPAIPSIPDLKIPALPDLPDLPNLPGIPKIPDILPDLPDVTPAALKAKADAMIAVAKATRAARTATGESKATTAADKAVAESSPIAGTKVAFYANGSFIAQTQNKDQFFLLNHADKIVQIVANQRLSMVARGKVVIESKGLMVGSATASEAFVKGTTYRREETKMINALADGMQALAQAMGTIGNVLTTATAVPTVGGPIIACQTAGAQLAQLASTFGKMQAALKVFEALSANDNYLSAKNFGD